MEKVTAYVVLFTLCVFGVTDEEVSVSVMKGDSVTLNTDVTKQKHEPILWYFNDTLIAQINGEANTSCLYDGLDGRFRDRLDVDYETGSLTIRDIRSEHAGRYEAEIIRSKSLGTSKSLNRTHKCDRTKITKKIENMGVPINTFIVTVTAADPDKADSQKDIKETETDKSSGLSTGVVAGIVVAVAVLLVSAAAGVIYYRRWRTGMDEERRKRDIL